jgi:hypothetical protein
MRTASWILTPVLVFGLTACPGDDNETDSTTASTTNTTPGTTTMTTSTTTMTTSTTDPTTSTTDPPTSTTDMTSSTTSTTDMTSSTSTTDMTTDTTGGGALSCDAYCALYMSGCANFAEYDNVEACLDQCSQWPVGTEADLEGDTLGCRTYHVTVANAQDPDVHCPHASPNGGGVCSAADAPKCADYCTAYLANCTGDNNAYKNEADCLDQCSHFYPGEKGATEGDSVGCREYHAGNPALSDPDTHCPHAGPGGGGVCAVQ